MLKVKKTHLKAILPTVAHPGEDLGYDLFALEDTILPYGKVTKVRTGISAAAFKTILVWKSSWMNKHFPLVKPLGLLIRDRSSMASKGIVTSGGVIDAGYRGEIMVLMTNHNYEHTHHNYPAYEIKAGDKIAQMVPIEVLTGEIIESEELPEANRGGKGFGSSGR